MSADNGIYILKTKNQYRVIHAQAIDNLNWSFLNKGQCEDLVSTRIVEYFGSSKYTHSQNIARSIAFLISKEYPILEYGIKEIEINKTWDEIVKEAKELAVKEIEAIEKYNDGRWDYTVDRLREIELCI